MRTHAPIIAALSAAGVFFTGLAAPASASETSWGDAPEPGLHRLLRDLVREARDHRPGARNTPGESLPHKRTPLDARCARDRPRPSARQTDDDAGPAP